MSKVLRRLFPTLARNLDIIRVSQDEIEQAHQDRNIPFRGRRTTR